MSETGKLRRGRLVSSKTWKVLVTWFGFPVPTRRDSHESADTPEQALYTGPSWKDAATIYSVKAYFLNHVRAFQRS